VQTGELAGQAALDDWARRSTGGMIREFPVELPPQVPLVLASALAARVSWVESFELVPGAALGPYSRWAGQLRRVLRTPQNRRMGRPKGWAHDQFIAATGEAGDVAVHTAWARGGLEVTSVAAQPGVRAAGVEAAAATGVAVGGRSRTRPGLLRTAKLGFGHPFVVVAVTADHGHPWRHAPRRSPWQGLPVFSAWITQPEDARNPT
jgi:hypothetical protein